MKLSLTALATTLALAASAQADPVLGVWQTSPDEGAYAHVKFDRCGGAICGTMIRSFNADGEYKSPNLGKKLFINMVPDGSGSYSGSAWRPANGKTYKGTMTISGNTLKAGGCVAGGLICIKNTMKRIK